MKIQFDSNLAYQERAINSIVEIFEGQSVVSYATKGQKTLYDYNDLGIRNRLELLYEVLLKYGLDLTLPIEEKVINDSKIYVIGSGALIVCFDDHIAPETVNHIAKLKEEYKSEIMRVVFKDSSFADAVVKTNALQTLKQFGIDEVVSI
ncbi:MAG: hypothetical protein IE909_12780 [Campylobacterales bacterium]|nr:hypothetical protein [Campylobacterales bacterium]